MNNNQDKEQARVLTEKEMKDIVGGVDSMAAQETRSPMKKVVEMLSEK